MLIERSEAPLHIAAVRPGEARPRLDGSALASSVASLQRAGYEHIVIDTPPVLGSADVNLIEDCVDGVLFVMRAGRSSRQELRRAVEQLAPTNLLGAVLLDI